MMRSTPLRRTPFKTKAKPWAQPERAPRTMLKVDPARFRVPQPITLPVQAIEKHQYVRNKALREAYRLIPCQHCGRNDGTVCCAHSNWAVHGKGGAIKADDSRGASLCSACHVPILDQGSRLSRVERQVMWWDAHVKSVTLLVALGHWPSEVAPPNTERCPF